MAEDTGGKPVCFCTRFSRWLTAPRGPSGTSYLLKGRFALTLFSSFHVGTIVGSAQNIMVEKFGADPTTMAVLWTILSLVGPFTSFIHGRLQDRLFLSRCFPVNTWGRRAPWLLTHTILACVAATVVYLPPGQRPWPAGDESWLYIWLMISVFLANWGVSSVMVAFEAARQEIFPFKEERIVVEGLCKYACMAGGSSGGPVVLILLANAAANVRLGCSVWIFLMSMFSIQAVPIFTRARSVSENVDDSGILAIFREMLPCARRGPNRAFRHIFAVKFWVGAYGGAIASVLFWYITVVLKLSGWLRSGVIAAGGLAAGLTESVMNIVFVWTFGAGDGRTDLSGQADRRMLMTVVSMRVVNAIVTFVCMGMLKPTVTLFIVWCITSRIGLCGYTFWRVSAQCWMVDEDCLQNGTGEKREGQIFGALFMTQSFAAAALSSVTFLGTSIAGLKSRNCNEICADLEGTTIPSAKCVADCDIETIEMQPESVVLFIRFVLAILAPVLELLIAYHTYSFPIKGLRLRRVYGLVQEQLGAPSAEPNEVPAAAGRRLSAREMVEAGTSHVPTSKIVLQVAENQLHKDVWKDRLLFTTMMLGRVPGPKSVAVIFDMHDADLHRESQRSGESNSSFDRIRSSDSQRSVQSRESSQRAAPPVVPVLHLEDGPHREDALPLEEAAPRAPGEALGKKAAEALDSSTFAPSDYSAINEPGEKSPHPELLLEEEVQLPLPVDSLRPGSPRKADTVSTSGRTTGRQELCPVMEHSEVEVVDPSEAPQPVECGCFSCGSGALRPHS